MRASRWGAPPPKPSRDRPLNSGDVRWRGFHCAAVLASLVASLGLTACEDDKAKTTARADAGTDAGGSQPLLDSKLQAAVDAAEAKGRRPDKGAGAKEKGG